MQLPENLFECRSYGYRLLLETCLGLHVEIIKRPEIKNAIISTGSRSVVVSCYTSTKEQLKTKSPAVVFVAEPILADFGFDLKPLPRFFCKFDAHSQNQQGVDLCDESLSFDIGLATFFVASGCWEIAAPNVDDLNRIKGQGSWLEQNGMLHLPILEIYSRLIARLLFQDRTIGALSQKNAKILLTCDVDRPRDIAFYSLSGVIRRLARNVLVERSFRAVCNTLLQLKAVHLSGGKRDPNNTFAYMMNMAELNGLQIIFFFLCHKDNGIDADYDLDDKPTVQLMKNILKRGHRIGIHGSFNSQYKSKMLSNEVNKFREAATTVGCLDQDVIARQHYLRWDSLHGAGIVERSKIDVDMSLGFRDCVGFRRGMCKPFQLFDLGAWLELNVKESPLIAMDCAVIETDFGQFDYEKCLQQFVNALTWTRSVGGEYVLLWHNSFLKTEMHRKIFEHLCQSDDKQISKLC